VKQRIDRVALLLVVGFCSTASAQEPPPTTPPPETSPPPAAAPEAAQPATQPATPPEPEPAQAAEPAAEAPEPAAAEPAAAAQDEGEQMIVTGSRIKRTSFAASAPVAVLDRKQLEQSGATTLADVVQNLTVGQGSGFQGAGSNAFAPGTVSIDLRGLGPGATLILLNGRRLPPSGGSFNAVSFQDLGTIPLAAVERIEILKGGASAIYGADAVGGVLNIITRKKFDGARIEADGQGTTHSFDQRQGSVSGVVGASSERGRVMLSMQYSTNNELNANQRAWTTRSNSLISQQGQPGSYIVGTSVMPDPNCTKAPGSSVITSPTGAAFCGFNFRNYQSLLGAGERANAFGSAEYDLTNHTTLFSELLVSRLRSDGVSSPSFPVAPPFPVVPANHVDNPFGQDVRMIGRPFGAASGPLRNTADDDTFRGLIGLKGDLEGVGKDTMFESWDWELSASFGQSRYHNILQDNIRPELQRALNSCSDPAHLENCYNPFYSSVLGTGTPNSAAIESRIKGQDVNLTDHALAAYNAGMSGNLFELPGGDVGIAFGTELRHEWRSSDSDHDANQNAYGFLIGNTDAIASRNTYSGYLELRWPFYDGIELQTAGRVEHYTDIAKTAASPSAGLTLTPAEIAGRDNVAPALRRLQFRGHATSAYRAPTLYQSFPGNLVLPELITDPTSPVPLFLPVKSYGNRALVPERALTVSAGFNWSPIDELSLLGEFWTYDYQKRIQPENYQQIASTFFADKMASGICPSDPHLVVDASCALQSINIKQKNVKGSLVTNGIDFGAIVSLTGATFGGEKKDFGTISAGVQGTYTLTYNLPYAEVLADAVKDGVKCDGTSPTSACHLAGNRNATNVAPPIPRWRMNFPVTWGYDSHTAAVITHFTSSVIDDQYAATTSKTVALPTMKGMTTVDLQYGYTIKDFIGKELTMRLGVYNLLDQAPPSALGAGLILNGFDPDLYDPRGRMVYAKLISHF
jgi:iron complex outermembrane receptor protein